MKCQTPPRIGTINSRTPALAAHARVAPDGQGTLPLRRPGVQTYLAAPANIRLVVVKVLPREPGLYRLGCATFTQRARALEIAVHKLLKPSLIGKEATRIEDVW